MKTDEIVFRTVKIAIDEWNLYSLFSEAPRDEFDSESIQITNLISKIKRNSMRSCSNGKYRSMMKNMQSLVLRGQIRERIPV